MTKQKNVFEMFKQGIKKEVIRSKTNLNYISDKNKECEKYLIDSLNEYEIEKKRFEDLKKFNKDIDKTIEKQIKEIEKFSFVKGVKLTTKGIDVDVGNIYIMYRNENRYIGDFTILITPSRVEIKNRNPIIVNEKGYKYKCEHPHIDEGHICYGGERQVKINQYFARFQLKELVYMVYLFLKTYSERDTYHSITYWTQEAKRKERKQKVNMNVKEEVKVIGGN